MAMSMGNTDQKEKDWLLFQSIWLRRFYLTQAFPFCGMLHMLKTR